MTTRQVAVPLVAAVLGSALTIAAMQAGGGSGSPVSRQGLLASNASDNTLSTGEIFDRASPSVVYIRARTVAPGSNAFDAEAGSDLSVSTGSGFVVDDDGRLLTNAHVINGVTAVQVTFADGRTVPAHVVGKDEQTDLAVLAVDPDGLDLRPLELGDSSHVQVGDQVVVVGNPNGLQPGAGTGRIAAEGQRVEAPGGYVISGVFATDAVIEPASSGGPLIGGDGRVVGITSRMDGANAFAVPANTARAVVSEIERSGKVIRPYIGLRGTSGDGGVQVTEVQADGPAGRAGIQAGDVIEAIDGKALTSYSELLVEVDRHAVGDTVRLSVLRNGSRGDVEVTLDQRPATLASG
jgi:S1-C subfamily serine protease